MTQDIYMTIKELTRSMLPLDRLFDDVALFHRTFRPNLTIPAKPKTLDYHELNTIADWIDSEVRELRDAETLIDQADAFLDTIYFALWGLVRLGTRPGKLWVILQEANMRKLWPDGKARLREGDDKIMKPPGWIGPEAAMQAEIELQQSIEG